MAKRETIRKAVLAITGIALAAVLFFAGYFTYFLTMSREQKYLLWAADMIAQQYIVYDEATGKYKEYTAEEMVKALIAGLPLDQYSAFYSEKEYADVIATSKGKQYGVGLTFAANAEDAVIYSVIGNSPAERAGILPGGRITALEYGGTTEEIGTYAQFAAALARVPANTEFYLWVASGGEPTRYVLRRESFQESYVRYADSETGYRFRSDDGSAPVGTEDPAGREEALGEDTAYLKLTSFVTPAIAQLAEALRFMAERQRTALILDLRNNGGGYMDALEEIASYFIPAEQERNVVAKAISKKGEEEIFLTPANRCDERRKSVIVLADDGTASASECLIGALQYYGVIDGAHLVITKNRDGRARTYGKGIMQTTYVNSLYGGALKLTTAYLYQPDGKTCIHGIGIGTVAENEIEPTEGVDAELLRAAEILKSGR